MDYLLQILRFQPMMITAGGLIAFLQFTASKLGARQSIHQKERLRARVIALNAFITSMNVVSDAGDVHGVCLQDALRERAVILGQLAAHGQKRSPRFFSRNAVQRLFLLYAPSNSAGWLLRWAFFTLIAAMVTSTVRGLLHMSRLPLHVRMTFLIVTFFLAVLVRLAAIHVEGQKPEGHMRTATAA